MSLPRISKVFGAINIGSFRISAMIMGVAETGELIVLGSSHRASQGIKGGYVTDPAAATYAIRDAVERAEKNAGTSISSVWVGCAGAGLSSHVSRAVIDIGGRRIEKEDVELLLVAARDQLQPDQRMVLHAQPAQYTLDGAHGVADPAGLHAEELAVDIHVMLADGAPVHNLIEAVQNAHLHVESVVGAPIAAGHACLSAEERELGVVLIEIGGDLTTVSHYAGGMMHALRAIPHGSSTITDAVAGAFGIRRFQAERLKCVSGSAMASPGDHREMIPVNGPNDTNVETGPTARGADDRNRIPRAELIGVVTEQLAKLTDEINRALKDTDLAKAKGSRVVLTGGGAELAGIAEFIQSALGRPVRIGRPPALRGLPNAHGVPGFATLAGLCLYAASDPVDIRTIDIGASPVGTVREGGIALLSRMFRIAREGF